MAKIQISIDDRLLEKVDSYVDQYYTTRSGLISQSINQYLIQQEAYSLVKQMSVTMQKIADKGEVDKDVVEELEDFHRICKLITGA